VLTHAGGVEAPHQKQQRYHRGKAKLHAVEVGEVDASGTARDQQRQEAAGSEQELNASTVEPAKVICDEAERQKHEKYHRNEGVAHGRSS
jgi:hypothetical protein